MTRKGHAPSSWARPGGAAPESHVGSQEAGPAPRPLPRRENPAERELATGDLGGEVTWGLGFAGGGGTGGRGSPPESKFPPGEDEWAMRMEIWDPRFRTPKPFFSQTQESWTSILSCLGLRSPKPGPTLSSSRQDLQGPQVPPHQELGFLASSFLSPKTQQPYVPSPSPDIILCHCDASAARA